MKHLKHLGAAVALGALVVAGLLVSPASAATTTGTWAQYPTGATEYQAEVQQPINTANTSNWSAKSKGAIPVQFKLSSRTGPAAFESIWSDTTTDNDYAFVSFTPSPSINVNQITNLSTDYTFTLGDCHGGSLRWQVRTDPDHALFIYYGAAPNFTDCTTVNQSGVNMIGQSDLRFDTSQYAGGTFYDTYTHAMSLIGTLPVVRASLVIDSGWQNAPLGDQRLTVSNSMVNDNAYTFVSAAGGSFAPTCTLPGAKIEVFKGDPVVDGAINEEPVQASLADDTNSFRVVDCKYQYILSIPSLKGTGTYQVQIWIDGTQVPTPTSPGGKVKFDLK
jgi:hypothetical protein